MRTREYKRRIAALTARGRGRVQLCGCAEQLQAIAEARVAVDGAGNCEYCGRPVTSDWSRFTARCERIYGVYDG